MPDVVSFHVLNKKFLEKDTDIPAQSEQIMYYSLAIGHHVGVIDCFRQLMDCPAEQYKEWIDLLPQEEEAYRKMKGVYTFGEIVIDSTHVGMLGDAFIKLKDTTPEPYKAWTLTLLESLKSMVYEPAMYLMVRLNGGRV